MRSPLEKYLVFNHEKKEDLFKVLIHKIVSLMSGDGENAQGDTL